MSDSDRLQSYVTELRVLEAERQKREEAQREVDDLARDFWSRVDQEKPVEFRVAMLFAHCFGMYEPTLPIALTAEQRRWFDTIVLLCHTQAYTKAAKHIASFVKSFDPMELAKVPTSPQQGAHLIELFGLLDVKDNH